MRFEIAAYLCLASIGLAEPSVDEPTPVLTVRLASMAKLRADATYLLKLAEFNEASNILSVLQFTSGNLTGIAEFDDTRQMTVVFAVPDKPAPLQMLLKPACVVIVPIVPLKKKSGIQLSLNLGETPPAAEKIANDLYRWRRSKDEESFVRVDDNVAFMSTDRKLIETVRSHMEELTHSSDENLTIEVKLHWRNVSAEWKKLLSNAARETAKQSQSGNQLNDGIVRFMANCLISLVEGCDAMIATCHVDPEHRQSHFRVRLRAAENSSLDTGLSFFSRHGTSFAPLRKPDSDLNISLSLRLGKETADLIRLFDPKVTSEGTKHLMKDPAVFASLRRTYDAYLDQANAINNSWLTVGRVDTTWSVREQDGQIKIFGGWHSVGAETVTQPAVTYFQQAAAHSTMFQADAVRIGELRLHQVGRDSYVGYAEDAVYSGWGIGKNEDWSQWVSDSPRGDSPNNGASIFIEGNCAFASQQRIKLKDQLPELFMFFLPDLPAAGRFQMTVDRRDHEMTANLTYDELALKSMVAGFLEKNAVTKVQSLVDRVRVGMSGK